MRALVQRVNHASVYVKGKLVNEIGKGLFVLVGIGQGDSRKDSLILTEKLSKLRVMADECGKMNKTPLEVGASYLIVSQFTLYSDVTGGNRPSFIRAEKPDKAKKLYELFISNLREKGLVVKTGLFGEYMNIKIEVDGPVTIMLDSNLLK